MVSIEKQSYTITETAAIIGVSRVTIHRWINNGNVKTVCIGGGFRRVPEKEIKRMLGE